MNLILFYFLAWILKNKWIWTNRLDKRQQHKTNGRWVEWDEMRINYWFNWFWSTVRHVLRISNNDNNRRVNGPNGLNRQQAMHEMDKGTKQEMTSTRLDSNDDVKHTYISIWFRFQWNENENDSYSTSFKLTTVLYCTYPKQTTYLPFRNVWMKAMKSIYLLLLSLVYCTSV